MKPNAKTQSAEDGGGPGPWIVTFSDCMTLLLCFFVLLMTFSSFDDVAADRLSGLLPSMSFDGLSDSRRTIRESVVPARPRGVDHTSQGSEMPTQHPPKRTENPQRPLEITSIDAYRDRKVFHIPSPRLFWGNGPSLTPSGTQYLGMVASFMKMVPCQVIVG